MARMASAARDCVIAQESGNHFNESILALNVARFEALDMSLWKRSITSTLVIHNYHDSGNVGSIRTPLGVPCVILSGARRTFGAAATVAGFALSPIALARSPRISRSPLTICARSLVIRRYESLPATAKR